MQLRDKTIKKIMLDIKLSIDDVEVVNETNVSEKIVNDRLLEYFGKYSDISINSIMKDVAEIQFAQCFCNGHVPRIAYHVKKSS